MTSTAKSLFDLKPGDTVERVLGRTVPMLLRVTEVTEDTIYCGPRGVGWKFCRHTGAEIDEQLGWGPRFGKTGSNITPVVEAKVH